MNAQEFQSLSSVFSLGNYIRCIFLIGSFAKHACSLVNVQEFQSLSSVFSLGNYIHCIFKRIIIFIRNNVHSFHRRKSFVSFNLSSSIHSILYPYVNRTEGDKSKKGSLQTVVIYN